MATDIRIGKRRKYTAGFTDDTGNPAKVDGSPVHAVTDPARGAIEEAADVLDGDGNIIGASGFLRITAAGPVDVQITGHDNDTGLDTTLVGQANGIAGDVNGGTFTFGDADE